MSLFIGSYFNNNKNTLVKNSWRWKIKLQHLLLFLTCSIFTVLIFVQVVSRYIFNYTFFGLEEAAAYLAVLMYFIGAASGTQMKSHISASLVDSLMKPGFIVDFIHIVTRAISVFISGYIAFEIWGLIDFTLMMNTKSMELRMPMIWIYSGMFAGTSLMTFYFFIEMLEDSISLFMKSKRKGINP